jgi:hypothetical protein
MSRKFLHSRISKVITVVSIVILLSALTTLLALAQDNTGAPEGQLRTEREANMGSYIPVQGHLTDSSGNALNGTYDMTFRLYTDSVGGTAICSDTNSNVPVTNGLFSTEFWGNCTDAYNGQQLYLGIEVETDGEMSPRQAIDAVPFALSLKPRAVILGSNSSDATLHIENSGISGRGLRVYATDTTSTNYGIVGASVSPFGYGGYFYNSAGGTGLKAESDSGAAIVASGTGIIRSTAQSSIWISGNDARPYSSTDTTVINLDSIGGAKISPGTTVSNKNIVLPITIPGPLYGQEVKVVAMDIYFQTAANPDAIAAVLLRRQTGVCETCYVNIKYEKVNHLCAAAANTTGCTLHYDLDSNNILNSSSGILYLTLELSFESTSSWIDFGGIRLALEHD